MPFYVEINLVYNTGIVVTLNLRLKELKELDEIESNLLCAVRNPDNIYYIVGELDEHAVSVEKTIPQHTGASLNGLLKYTVTTKE